MSQFPNSFSQRKPVELDYGTDSMAVFSFFNSVYAWMATALAVTGISAWLTSQNLAVLSFLYTKGMSLAIMVGLVLLVMAIRPVAYKVSAIAATGLFLIYAALVGMAISGIFVVYKLSSIAGVFAISAGMFGGMSVYGFVTRRNLTAMGSILIMVVWGLFLAIIVNIFLQSSALSWIVSIIGVVAFSLLTAYDTQKLKQVAQATMGSADMAARAAIIGSVDFINLFLFLLRLMGSRR